MGKPLFQGLQKRHSGTRKRQVDLPACLPPALTYHCPACCLLPCLVAPAPCPACCPLLTVVGADNGAGGHLADGQRAGAVRTLIQDAAGPAVGAAEQHPGLAEELERDHVVLRMGRGGGGGGSGIEGRALRVVGGEQM